MPRYQYACPDCGNQFEAQQKFTDKPLKKCPTCGKKNLYRVIGQVAVAFKGTGFYINDSKSGNGTKSKADENKPEVKPEATAETKADASAETKAEAGTQPGTEATKPAEKIEAKADSAASKSEAKPAAEKPEKKAKRKA